MFINFNDFYNSLVWYSFLYRYDNQFCINPSSDNNLYYYVAPTKGNGKYPHNIIRFYQTQLDLMSKLLDQHRINLLLEFYNPTHLFLTNRELFKILYNQVSPE